MVTWVKTLFLSGPLWKLHEYGDAHVMLLTVSEKTLLCSWRISGHFV